MNKDNSKLLILYEESNYCSIKDVDSFVQELSNLGKGLKYVETESSKTLYRGFLIRQVSNKYYTCEIDLIILKESEHLDIKISHIDGIIYLVTSDLLNKDKVMKVCKYLKNDAVSLFLLCFREKLASLEEYNDLVPLKEFCCDVFVEIVSDVFNYKDIDAGNVDLTLDDGILRVNDAIQSNFWKNTSTKEKSSAKAAQEVKYMTDHQNLEETKPNVNDAAAEKKEDKTEKKEPTISASLSKGEEEPEDNFLQVIEKMKALRNDNMKSNMTDEERRKNAENAIQLLAQYMPFDDDDDDEQ